MWFNSMIREEPYPGLKCGGRRVKARSLRGRRVGAAWLSSARAVRCRLKCHNERNPRRRLPAGHAGDSVGTAPARGEEGGMTSNQHGPYVRGDTRVTMGGYSGLLRREPWRIPKAPPSSDRSLQPDSVKLDSLVIAHQPWRGEYVPGPCTHRPSSHGSRGCLKCAAARGALGQNR